MLAILNVTIPFFALVACGYVAARARRVPGSAVGALNTFVLYFALPAMLFRFAAGAPLATIANPPVIAAYGLTGLLVLALTVFGLRWGNRDNWADAAFGALAASWSNWGYMGFALLPALLGERAIAVLIAAGITDFVLVVSAALALAARADRGHASVLGALGNALGGVARNPLIWAIGAGMAASALELRLPVALDEFLRLLGTAAGPVALFAIGVSLYRPQNAPIGGDTVIMVVTKLLIHPLLCAAVAIHLFGVGREAAQVLILMATLPAAGTVFLFAERQGANHERISAVILLSTVMAFFTFTAFAALVTGGR